LGGRLWRLFLGEKMRGTLVVGVLTVSSSYKREVEHPLEDGGVPDTVQWWIAETGSWRIRTYALDHDIHTFSVGSSPEGLRELAIENTQKHYGDVLARLVAFEIADTSDQEDLRAYFGEAEMTPYFDVADGQFMFWKPDDAEYHTQSSPKAN
jgi:hypothetical protein